MFRKQLGGPIAFGGIFDRDFRPDEEIDELLEMLESDISSSRDTREKRK